MNRRLRIQHQCSYQYPHAQQYSAHALRLTPRRDSFQRTLFWTLQTRGRRVEQLDAHGNITHLLTLEEAHRQVDVLVTGVVETTWSEQALKHEGPLSPLTYLAATPLTRADAELTGLAETHRPRAGATWEWITYLGRELRERRPDLHRAVDLAHAYLALCRAAGVPARFVSGYCQVADDRADRMAWVDVWSSPQDGWIALDVDRLEPAGSRHCRLAVGRDYRDASPMRSHLPGESTETLRIRDQ
ncbi:MAG TPA: transglutaminase family protein [Steroidobacteraceae bacterium]|nr:transglutaminase family protein [Steroidobacteraceae bacterium]